MEFNHNENLYKEVLRTMSDCVLIYDKSGNFIALNDHVEKVLGIESSLLTESTLKQFEFVREDSSRLHYSDLPNVITLRHGSPFHNFIVGINNQNSNIRWLSINSTPLKLDEYGEQAALVTMSDITERKKMEQAIIQAKEEAEKANVAKSDFLSKMSHELRTPLNGILGFAQLLEMDESLNEEQRDFVQEILSGGSHLLNLINDILDLSRIETGKLKISIEEVDLLTIINECIHIVQPLAGRKSINIHKKWDQWQNPFVLADPIRLRQVILNLLDNAIKYNKEGGTVTITYYVEGNNQIIHIVDTGVGLSVDEYHKVFVPFYRIEGTQEEGTGIGLSLVKQLVNLMGGEINVMSTKGEGSDFFFNLPLPHELEAAVQWGEQVEVTPPANTGKAEHYRILYVEDNDSNLHFVRSIMKSQPSYTLLTARSGKEGVEIATKEEVDLILLDLNLPDLHGYEVLDRLKTGDKTKDTAIIAVSANAIPQDIQEALDKGFHNYVTKPIHVKEFLRIINETLNSTITHNIPDHEILSTSPHGEAAVAAKTLQLSWKDLGHLKEKNYRAAISLHYSSDWSMSQVEGLKDTFKKMGIEVTLVMDAEFIWEKQVADIETILAEKPDILVSIPVNTVATARVFKQAAESGIKLVFMDNTPKDLQPGKDYVSVVSADNYGNGMEAAHIMAEKIEGKGKIGIIYYDADFFVTNQRTEAFEKTILEKYPNILIVDRIGIMGPAEGEKAASTLMANYHDLNGIFVVWDAPAEGAMAAARKAGRNNLVITTIDLGRSAAIEIAKGGLIKGLGAQLPYQQGVAEAILAGYALLGKQAPPYVAVPSLKVTRDNLLEAWKLVYHEDAPEAIQRYF